MRPSKFKDMRFYSDEEVQSIKDDLGDVITVPVNVRIEAQQRVFDFSEMREILEQAENIGVHNCGCKSKFRNCDAPLDVCISLDTTAEELVQEETESTQKVSIERALEVLERSHRAGLVHMAYMMKGEEKPFLICSCCPCCCHTLGSLVRSGAHDKILTSKFISSTDQDRCQQCGVCIERCAFQARQMIDRKLVCDLSKCFGCGLCVSTCSPEAISLVQR